LVGVSLGGSIRVCLYWLVVKIEKARLCRPLVCFQEIKETAALITSPSPYEPGFNAHFVELLWLPLARTVDRKRSTTLSGQRHATKATPNS
jgi:hypothetical protein